MANFLKTASKLKENAEPERFRPSIVPLVIVESIIWDIGANSKLLKKEESSAPQWSKLRFQNAASIVAKCFVRKNKVLSKKDRLIIKRSDQNKIKTKKIEENYKKLEPKIESRIICLQNEK